MYTILNAREDNFHYRVIYSNEYFQNYIIFLKNSRVQPLKVFSVSILFNNKYCVAFWYLNIVYIYSENIIKHDILYYE